MSDEQRPIPEFLRPHLTQEQYDRLREYLKTPHTRVDLTMEEWDSVKNGQGWPKGSRIEHEVNDFVAGYRVSGRWLWRDRAAGWPIADLQKFIVGMSKPAWWRLIARWKWRKPKRSMAKPQPALAGWKAIDCRNAPGHLSDVVFEPESFVLHDPMSARYNSLDDAVADMKEGTRKRAIRPLEKVGGRIRQRQEYRDAPIGVGIGMLKDPYQIAYETKSPGDQETKNEETK